MHIHLTETLSRTPTPGGSRRALALLGFSCAFLATLSGAPREAGADSNSPDRENEHGHLDEPSPLEQAPDEYSVRLSTSDGVVLIDVTRAWAPRAADRFFNLVHAGYYDGTPFHRVIGGYLAQFGVPLGAQASKGSAVDAGPSDPRLQPNTSGTVAFVPPGAGEPDGQVVISVKDNADLDALGHVPFGKVRHLYIVDHLYFGYADAPPSGKGPDLERALAEGRSYLTSEFPELDWIRRARVATPLGGGFAGPQPPPIRRPKRGLGAPRVKRKAPAAPSHSGGGGGGHSH